MAEEIAYEGTDLKYAIVMEAPGFSMEEDDWSVEIRSGKKVLATYPKEDCIVDGDGQYYVCIEHDVLSVGTIDIVFRASVPDTDFPDGIRDEVDKKKLIVLKKL